MALLIHIVKVDLVSKCRLPGVSKKIMGLMLRPGSSPLSASEVQLLDLMGHLVESNIHPCQFLILSFWVD